MEKGEVIARLRCLEPALRAMGADALFLFGSTARGEHNTQSDIDVFLDIAPGRPFTLLDLAAAQRLLSEGLAAPADLTTRDGLHPALNARIMAESIRVF